MLASALLPAHDLFSTCAPPALLSPRVPCSPFTPPPLRYLIQAGHTPSVPPPPLLPPPLQTCDTHPTHHTSSTPPAKLAYPGSVVYLLLACSHHAHAPVMIHDPGQSISMLCVCVCVFCVFAPVVCVLFCSAARLRVSVSRAYFTHCELLLFFAARCVYWGTANTASRRQ